MSNRNTGCETRKRFRAILSSLNKTKLVNNATLVNSVLYYPLIFVETLAFNRTRFRNVMYMVLEIKEMVELCSQVFDEKIHNSINEFISKLFMTRNFSFLFMISMLPITDF